MKRYILPMDKILKKNASFPQMNSSISLSPNQNPRGFFFLCTTQIDSQLYMEREFCQYNFVCKFVNVILKQKKTFRGLSLLISRLAVSYHKQDNGILTKGRAQQSMAEKLQPTKIPLHILSVDFQRICEINCMEKIPPFPEILLEHLDNI